MNYFNFNGKLFKEGSPVIGPDNRGVRYGDGLFETMKMKNGKLLFEDEHFARLWKGLKILQFEIPRHFTVDNLKQDIIALAEKNGHQSSARVRVNIVRGDGGLYDAKNHFPLPIIQTWDLQTSAGNWNSNGMVLGVYNEARKSCDAFSNLKHNNYLPYAMAALHAKKERWNDAIVLNSHGRVCDSTIANIFVVKDDIISTPSLAEGCVAGVTRKMLIKILPGAGWQISEREIDLEELTNADEVFLTNSMYNLRWVQLIGDRNYNHTVSRKIFETLMQTISEI